MIDRRPALIAQCAGSADVIAAVNFAREHELLVAVRGGGHHVAGNAVCDGGLVIDLSRMKGLRIDPVRRTARAEAGLTWGELNHDLQAFGLGATGGYISITGIPGLTLGGGFGWLVRKHGLALDNLLSVDIVTADGQLRTASPTEHPDSSGACAGPGPTSAWSSRSSSGSIPSGRSWRACSSTHWRRRRRSCGSIGSTPPRRPMS